MITIAAEGANERGDIFTRLMSDMFHSLGYEKLRFNIHQTGREVDIIGTHCTEHRMLVAECKAQVETIGAAELNKFYGVLDAERRKTNIPTEGYFASLSGFKESAIQQENDLGGRFALLNEQDIVNYLVRGRIIVESAYAIAEAAKWLDPNSAQKTRHVELVAHESGWHWLVTYGDPAASQISSYSVIHADGYVLESDRAQAIVAQMKFLTGIHYAGPDPSEADSNIDIARRRYVDYLIKEYGYITLEGLPADQEVGSRSLRLESIFVPLSLEKIAPEITDEDLSDESDDDEGLNDLDVQDFEFDASVSVKTSSREAVGTVLAGNNRLALLGSPGAGKTTLLKRLAVAYAAPGRRTASRDRLPDRDWFPIVIRCRHLGSNVSEPVLKGIEGLTERAEMPELAEAFRECVRHELRAGRVLLLVDGLDEIASPTDRSTFVSQLRTFLGTYPSASLIVTSREFGFRTVAGSVASLCTTYRVAELSAQDVRTVTLSWHREVVGRSAAVRASAAALAESILRTDRVRRLAVNPLLLTTLLLVRRWLGELPRKRSVLYAKAIEVLLMTWNVEGHQPLDPDEALPQLGFAAFCMMQKNVQTVSIKELTGYFSEARRQMPELLGYSRISVGEFVSRVEERSSLLNLSGHMLEDGQLRATYEFKHLTFQEYLAALAAANGYYPNRREDERLVDVLEPYIAKSSWREVIPLAGVLGGRSGGALVERIIENVGPHKDFFTLTKERRDGVGNGKHEETDRKRDSLLNLLSRCLADDVPLSPETLARAISTVLTQLRSVPADEILAGRYATEFLNAARDGYANFDDRAYQYGSALAFGYILDGQNIDESLSSEFCQRAMMLIESSDPMERVEGCLRSMHAAFIYRDRKVQSDGKLVAAWGRAFTRFRTCIFKLMEDEQDERVIFAGFWALSWLVEIRKPTALQTSRLLRRLWDTWRTTESVLLQRQCAWTIWALPLLDRDEVDLDADQSSDSFLQSELNSEVWSARDRSRASLVVSYYLGRPWTDGELVRMARSTFAEERHNVPRDKNTWLRFFKRFGSLGSEAVAEIKAGDKRPRSRA